MAPRKLGLSAHLSLTCWPRYESYSISTFLNSNGSSACCIISPGGDRSRAARYSVTHQPVQAQTFRSDSHRVNGQLMAARAMRTGNFSLCKLLHNTIYQRRVPAMAIARHAKPPMC